MITKNFKLWQKALLSTIDITKDNVVLTQPIKTVSGEEITQLYYYTSASYYKLWINDTSNAIDFSTSQTSGSTELYVGSNGAETTENDYTLDVISTLSSSGGATKTRYVDGDNQVISITRTFTNTSTESITVREMGLVKRVEKSANNSVNVLLAREVLPTPLVVPSGANFTVSMVVRV